MADDKITRYEDVKIDDLPRDLRFRPSKTENPQALAHEQIDAYNKDGYIKGIRIFSPSEIADIRSYFDELLARVLAAGGNSYSIATAHAQYGRVWDLLNEKRIVAHVQDILGPDIIGWGSHFFCKMPKDGKTVSWHQDASYWPMSPSKTVTVWLAIDDADTENACMRFVPGTHHHGHLTYHLSEEDENNVLFQTVPNAEQYGEPVDVELSAGEISMHSDLLLHGSNANESDRRRCGLTLRYCAADVRAMQGWHLKGVIVAGRDEEGHWANPARPAKD
jgi:non-heme Fe2+,alpha-ketoglutarate-dependent halogenase